ncbi:MAG: squalene/phytoene synthase family protein [Kordiimonadaceae bacterium]|nr:squalene/phytoene synthase family protein [Kordiimonadaceae bacterium]
MIKQTHNADYCRNLVRGDDKERYLASLYAPSKARRGLWALFAFNQELAKIRENVSDLTLGSIRLQWWGEVLSELESGTVRKQPVIAELEVITKIPQVLGLLRKMVEAREIDMFEKGTANLAALKSYASGAGGALHEAAFRVVGAHDSVQGPDEGAAIAQAIGTAWSLMGLLRALPYHWQSGRTYMPEDLHAAMEFQDPKKTYKALVPTIQAVVRDIAECLEVASKQPRSINPALKSSLAYMTIVKLHLKALEKADGNPFEMERFSASDLKKMTHLFYGSVTNRF